MALNLQDIVSWTVNNELRGGNTADIVVNNLTNSYNEDFINEYIELTGYYSGYSSKVFFKGIVTEVNPVYRVRAELDSSLRCSSVFRFLDGKPVNTEQFSSISGADLMTRLVTEYGGIDSSYVNITEDNGTVFENIIISEDSIISVLRKIAQVCQVELFVKEGILVTENYKTDSSAIDYAFAESDLYEVSLTYSIYDSASCVVVRGRFETEQELSTVTIFDDYVEYNSQYDLYNASFMIPLDKCYDLVSLENAVVTTPDDADVDVVSSGVAALDGCWMFVTLHSSNFITNRRIRVVITVKPVSLKERSGRNWKENYQPTWSNMFGERLSGWRIGYPYMPKVKGWLRRVRYLTDEQAEDRINYTVCDTELVSEVGYRYTEIDNPYIFNSTVAQNVALRYLQELKQGRKRWNLRGPWNPNIRVNSKVSFPVLGTSVTKTGVVVSETIEGNASSGAVDAIYVVEELS